MLISVNCLLPWDLNLHVGLASLHVTLRWTIEVLLCSMHVMISWGSRADEVNMLR